MFMNVQMRNDAQKCSKSFHVVINNENYIRIVFLFNNLILLFKTINQNMNLAPERK